VLLGFPNTDLPALLQMRHSGDFPLIVLYTLNYSELLTMPSRIFRSEGGQSNWYNLAKHRTYVASAMFLAQSILAYLQKLAQSLLLKSQMVGKN
jgi:hypothetical protein